MHVGVLVLVVLPKRIDYSSRLLRGCGVIKINQRMTMHLLAENREILADGAPVHHAGSNLVYTIICSARSRAPLYSDTTERLAARDRSRTLRSQRIKSLTLEQPFPDIISIASAEVRTGTISKSIRSSQFAIQRSNNAK